MEGCLALLSETAFTLASDTNDGAHHSVGLDSRLTGWLMAGCQV